MKVLLVNRCPHVKNEVVREELERMEGVKKVKIYKKDTTNLEGIDLVVINHCSEYSDGIGKKHREKMEELPQLHFFENPTYKPKSFGNFSFPKKNLRENLLEAKVEMPHKKLKKLINNS